MCLFCCYFVRRCILLRVSFLIRKYRVWQPIRLDYMHKCIITLLSVECDVMIVPFSLIITIISGVVPLANVIALAIAVMTLLGLTLLAVDIAMLALEMSVITVTVVAVVVVEDEIVG